MRLLGRWLWRLLPGNPMVGRIVAGGSRRTRDLWIRMGYLGALIILVLVGLLRGGVGWGMGGGGGGVSLTDLAKAGAWVFAVIAYGQVILICLLAPLFMAGAISSEQSGKTYDILLTTPLSNMQIVLGSLAGRLFFVLALLASGLPLFAILMIFGGVPIVSVFVSFAVAALTAWLVGSVAVTLSVFRAGGRKAVFIFVIAIAAYLIAGYALDVLVLRPLMPGAGGHTTTWLTPLHPLLVLEAALSPANYHPPTPQALAGYGPVLRFYLGRPLATFAIWTSAVSFILIVVNAVLLRHLGQGGSWLPAWLRRIFLLPEHGGERSHPPRPVGANPIAWREANTRGKVGGRWIARWGFVAVGFLAAVVLLCLYHFHLLPQVSASGTVGAGGSGGGGGGMMPAVELFHHVLYALLVLEVAIISLVALYMAAGCVSREREDGTLDLLLTTPITPRMIVWGKLRGLVMYLSAMIAVPVGTLALTVIYAVIGRASGWSGATYQVHNVTQHSAMIVHQSLLVLPGTPVLLALMLVPFIGLCVAAGMNWSLKSASVLGAVVPAVAVVGVLTLVLGFCGWNAAATIPLIGPVINALSPATNLAMLIDPWHRINGFAQAPLFGRLSLAVAAVVAAGAYGVVVYSLITGMVGRFDQTVRRLTGEG